MSKKLLISIFIFLFSSTNSLAQTEGEQINEEAIIAIMSKGIAEEMVKRFDRDGDGKLSPMEMVEEGKENFNNTDINGDGYIDIEEIASSLINSAKENQ